MISSRTTLLLAAALSFASVGIAQSPASYDPLKTFAPLTLPDPVNSYRSANGAPGPLYWQNRADYEIYTAIDTATKTLTNTDIITYTNNSPDTLTSLWLNLEQNAYRRDSRNSAHSDEARQANTSTSGYSLDSVEVESGDKAAVKPERVTP